MDIEAHLFYSLLQYTKFHFMGCDRRGNARRRLAPPCLAESWRRVPAKVFLPPASRPLVERALHAVVISVAQVSYSVPEAPELSAGCLARHNSQRGSAGRSLEVASLLQLLLRVVVSTCKTVVCKPGVTGCCIGAVEASDTAGPNPFKRCLVDIVGDEESVCNPSVLLHFLPRWFPAQDDSLTHPWSGSLS